MPPIMDGCMRPANEVGVAGGGPRVSIVALMPSSSGFLGGGGAGAAADAEATDGGKSLEEGGLVTSFLGTLNSGLTLIMLFFCNSASRSSGNLTPALRSFSRLSRSICSLKAFSFSALSLSYLDLYTGSVVNMCMCMAGSIPGGIGYGNGGNP